MATIRLATLNVRGLSAKRRQNQLYRLIIEQDLDIVAVQETKVESEEHAERMVQPFTRVFDVCVCHAVGASAGCLLLIRQSLNAKVESMARVTISHVRISGDMPGKKISADRYCRLTYRRNDKSQKEVGKLAVYSVQSSFTLQSHVIQLTRLLFRRTSIRILNGSHPLKSSERMEASKLKVSSTVSAESNRYCRLSALHVARCFTASTKCMKSVTMQASPPRGLYKNDCDHLEIFIFRGISWSADMLEAFFQGRMSRNTIAFSFSMLGATHDPKDSSNCSWSQGFLMSYEDKGANKYILSDCSQDEIRKVFKHQKCLQYFGVYLYNHFWSRTVAHMRERLSSSQLPSTAVLTQIRGQGAFNKESDTSTDLRHNMNFPKKVRPDIDDPSQTSDDAAAATDDQNITVDDPIAGKALSAMSRQGTQKKRRRSPHRLDEILAQRQTVLEKIAASVGQPASTTQQEDDIDYFGKVVAAHMREVPKDKLIPCQKAILSALEIYINKSDIKSGHNLYFCEDTFMHRAQTSHIFVLDLSRHPKSANENSPSSTKHDDDYACSAIVDQGFVKATTLLWLNSKRCRSFKLRLHLSELNEKLLSLQPIWEISRLPRSLNDLKHWKCADWRNWLLFYSPIVLASYVPEKNYRHWVSFVDIMYYLLSDCVALDRLNIMKNEMVKFVKEYQELYGITNMTYNAHLLLHLVDTVKHWGLLWAHSMFGFESMNEKLVKMVKGTRYPENRLLTSSSSCKPCLRFGVMLQEKMHTLRICSRHK
ncbi:hypothetical protein HPB51_006750 [Rhipicephalus microplus]|uniref:Endonuclease/exonuclease/phosphatase domain-containing protein n=1 Tax=Rhipicephalus microplus TaxID=6941 RepID=A0A9J6E7I9_RHIMP|nr:hypothetical protein HPB51_006750 [Rhipicephalus microplus]